MGYLGRFQFSNSYRSRVSAIDCPNHPDLCYSNSLIDNANLISKVYFPRLIVTISVVIVSFVDFLLSGMILLGLMAWYIAVLVPVRHT
ncbi:hypothetical protein MiAbW_02590 [Microcystis aeruginosa NIES-4325]|uniref:Uncharacterized protein n=1 Tax=Microcystis aeruginosa NIES-4325 TaxID=2569534 RepID=A0A5J4FAK3_MICAE|nr:hypothetical protein [Microcystis aeruginosa]GEA28019.1 hypothetical protein MiAbW_02590 [Microcystis aeruginosa NIES-4325]